MSWKDPLQAGFDSGTQFQAFVRNQYRKSGREMDIELILPGHLKPYRKVLEMEEGERRRLTPDGEAKLNFVHACFDGAEGESCEVWLEAHLEGGSVERRPLACLDSTTPARRIFDPLQSFEDPVWLHCFVEAKINRKTSGKSIKNVKNAKKGKVFVICEQLGKVHEGPEEEIDFTYPPLKSSKKLESQKVEKSIKKTSKKGKKK